MPLRYDSRCSASVDNSVTRVFLGVDWQFDGVTVKGPDPNGEFGVPATADDLGRRGGVWLGCQLANQLAPKIGITAATMAASKA